MTVSVTANSNLQNRINISIIFNYLRSHGPAYRAQIARSLGISAPAVSRAVEKLLRDGFLIESEKVQVENGKKAAQLSINSERGFIVGVDILTDPIELAISDFSGTVLYSRKGPAMDEEADLAQFLIAAIDEGLRDFGEEPGRRGGPVLAVGIGVPAVVDPMTSQILSASLYKNLAASDFHRRIGERYGAPVFVENISNLAAIGEWKRGVGQGVRTMVFIELSNGIGAGIILDGDLYRGALGSAGEIGYFITQPGGLGHDSSRRGFLESVASLGSMVRREGRADSLASLCAAAQGGDEGASTVIADSIGHLAVAIVNIMVLLNPEVVVIGGNVCELPGAESLIARPLIEEILRNYPFKPASVRLTSLGAQASVFGALQFALDSLIVHAYPYRL